MQYNPDKELRMYYLRTALAIVLISLLAFALPAKGQDTTYGEVWTAQDTNKDLTARPTGTGVLKVEKGLEVAANAKWTILGGEYDNTTILALSPTGKEIVFNSEEGEYQFYSADAAAWLSLGGAGGISLWVTATDYEIDDVVIETNRVYIALTNHTSGTFATDLAANRWIEVSRGIESPGAVTDECVPRYNGTTGWVIQNSVLCVTDAGVLTGPTQLTVDQIRLDGSKASALSGDLTLEALDDVILSADPVGSTGGLVKFSNGGELPKAVGSRNPELKEWAPYPSFEEGTVDLQCDNCTGLAPAQVGSVGAGEEGEYFGQFHARASYGGATTDTIWFMPGTNLPAAMPVKVSCFIKTSRTGVTFRFSSTGSGDADNQAVSNGNTWAQYEARGTCAAGVGEGCGWKIVASASSSANIDINACTITADDVYVELASSQTSGVLTMAKGGTSKNLTPVAGANVYTDGDSFEVGSAGTLGQYWKSNTGSAPTWADLPPNNLNILHAQDFEKAVVAASFTTGSSASLSGGSIAGTLADETGSPVNGTKSLKFTQTGSSLNDFALSPTITVPAKYKGQAASVFFSYNYNGASGDIRLIVYDDANSQILTSTLDVFTAPGSSQNVVAAASIYIPTNATTLRYGFLVTVANNTKVLVLDDVFVVAGGFYSATEDRQWLLYSVAQSSYQNSDGEVRFPSGLTTSSFSGPLILSVSDDAGNTRTKFIASRKTACNVGYSSPVTSVGYMLQVWKNGSAIHYGSQARANAQEVGDSSPIFLEANDYLTVGPPTGQTISSGTTYLTIVCEADNTALITPQIGDDSAIYAIGANGFASTNNKIRRYDSATTNGTQITYADSATLGASATINESGVYQACVNDQTTGSTQVIGMSVNTTQPTTAINATSDNSALGQIDTGPDYGATCVMRYFNRGDIIRPHMNVPGSMSSSSDYRTSFSVTKVGFNSMTGVPLAKIAYLREEVAANTDGGTATSGAWRTRTLNTRDDPSGIVILSSNAFTLGPGDYYIEASAPAYDVNSHQIRLQNTTDATTAINGSSEWTAATDAVQTRAMLAGRVTLTSAKVFELQHQVETTSNTQGFGVSVNFVINEVYSIVKITKIR